MSANLSTPFLENLENQSEQQSQIVRHTVIVEQKRLRLEVKHGSRRNRSPI